MYRPAYLFLSQQLEIRAMSESESPESQERKDALKSEADNDLESFLNMCHNRPNKASAEEESEERAKRRIVGQKLSAAMGGFDCTIHEHVDSEPNLMEIVERMRNDPSKFPIALGLSLDMKEALIMTARPIASLTKKELFEIAEAMRIMAESME